MLRHSSEEDPKILKTAIEWFVASQSESWDKNQEYQFQKWLEKSPRHQKHFQQAEKIWLDLDALKASKIPHLASARKSRSAKNLHRSLAVAFVVFSAILGLSYQDYISSTTYDATGLGERKQILLSDASVITLNANTRITVHESWIRRQIYLLEGEAQFEIKHQAFRPLIVATDTIKVLDIGTVFNVRNRPESKSIAVLEGEVDLINKESLIGDTLTAGFSREFNANGEFSATKQINNDQASAWLTGHLVFNQTPLNHVTAELERFHSVKFVFKTPNLAKQTISGNFGTSDLNSFLQGLTEIYGVNVRRNQNRIEISSK